MAWWQGEGNANDGVNTNNGTLRGGVSFAAGEVGQGFSFGSTGYVEVPHSDAWAFGTSDFSIEYWANFASYPSGDEGNPSGGGMIAFDEGSGDVNKWMFTTGGSVIDFHINDPVNGPICLVNAGFTPVLNTWYHLAVTRSGNTFTIYVNGAAVGSGTSSRVIPNASAPLTIGQAEGYYFNGSLDEISIYNRALFSAEIAAIYIAGGAGKCPPTPTPPVITTQPTNQTAAVVAQQPSVWLPLAVRL